MKYPTSHSTPFLPTFPGKIVCKRIESAKDFTRAPAIPLSTFRMNTCKSVSKQRTLSPFRMNTYAKTGGRGAPGGPPTLRAYLQNSSISKSLVAPPRRAGLYLRTLTNPWAGNTFLFTSMQIPGDVGVNAGQPAGYFKKLSRVGRLSTRPEAERIA